MIKSFLATVMVVASSIAVQAETIGVSQPKEANTFQKVMWRSVEDAATKANVSLKIDMAKGDPNLQVKQLDAMYAAGVDGVIVSLSSSKMANVLADNARQARKPLVFINAAPPAGLLGSGVAFVGSDEIEAGTLQMTEVCRQMKGKGTVAILMGELSHPGARGRTTAVHAVLASPPCSSIELLEEQSAGWSRPQAQEIVRSWLRAGLKPDAIVANNDDMALGAIDALKAAGIKGTIIAGIDATDAGLAAMQGGDLNVTVLQDAQQQGEKAVAVDRAMIAGQAVPPATMIPFKLIMPAQAAQLVSERTGG